MTTYDVTEAEALDSLTATNGTLAKDIAYDALAVTASGAEATDGKLAELNLIVDRVTLSQQTTAADLEALNIQNVNADLTLGYKQALVDGYTADLTAGAQLQAVVDTVNAATTKIFAAIASGTTATLDLTDLVEAGIYGVQDEATASAVIARFSTLTNPTETGALQREADQILSVLKQAIDYVDGTAPSPSNEALEQLGLSTYESTDYYAFTSVLNSLSDGAISTYADLEAQLVVAEQNKAQALARLKFVADGAQHLTDFVPDLDATGNEAYVSGASARTAYNDTSGEVLAFDDDTATLYHSATGTATTDQWIAFVDPTGLMAGNLTAVEWVGRSTFENRIPNNLRLEGTNDGGATWTVIENFDNNNITDGTVVIDVSHRNQLNSYSGFRLFSDDLTNSKSGADSLNLTELQFTVKQAATLEAYLLAGIQGVTEANLGFVNAYLRTSGVNDISTPDLATLQSRVDVAINLVDRLAESQTGNAASAWTRTELESFELDVLYDADELNITRLLQVLQDPETTTSYETVVAKLQSAAVAFDATLARASEFVTNGFIASATDYDYIVDVDTDADALAGVVHETSEIYNNGNYTAEHLFDYSSSTILHDTNSAAPETFGWINLTTEAEPVVLSAVRFDGRDGYAGRTPGDFAIMGWTGSAWETIQTYSVDHAYNAWQTYSITADAGDQQFKAYTGFAIRVEKSGDSDNLVNLQRVIYDVKPAYLDFSVADWAALGQLEVNEANLAAMNALVSLLDAQSTNTDIMTDLLSLTAADISGYVSALAAITDYMTGDSATSPTLQQYQTLFNLLSGTDAIFQIDVDRVDGLNLLLAQQRIAAQPNLSTVVKNIEYALEQQNTMLDKVTSLVNGDSRWNDTYVFDYSSQKTGSEMIQSGEHSDPWDKNDGHYAGGYSWISWNESHANKAFDPWLGYVDKDGSQGETILQSFYMQTRNSNMDLSKFAVEGLNPDTGKWELIKIFEETVTHPGKTLTVDAQRTYGGYRVVFMEESQYIYDDRVEIDYLRFNVKSASRAVTVNDVEALGVTGVNESNIDLVLNALTEQSDLNSLTLNSARIIAQAAVDAFTSYAALTEDTIDDIALADLHALGFTDLAAGMLPAVKVTLANLLASDLPINSNTVTDAVEQAQYNLTMAQRLASVIADSASTGEFLGTYNYVPDLTTNNDAGLLYHSTDGSGWGQPYYAFDKRVEQANSGTAYRTFGLSAEQIASIGWFDAQNLRGPAILKRVIVENRQNQSGGYDYEIGDFVVKGYNPLTGLWEEIESVQTYNSNTEALYVDIDSTKAYEGFRLDIFGRTNDSAIIQEIRFEVQSFDVFEQAGLENVNADNLFLVAEALGSTVGQTLNSEEMDTAIAQATDAAAVQVNGTLDVSRASNTTGVISLEMLGAFGVTGHTSQNLADIEAALLSADATQTSSPAGIAQIAQATITAVAEANLLDMVAAGTAYTEGLTSSNFVPVISDQNDADIEGLVIDSLNNQYRIGSTYHMYRLFDGQKAVGGSDHGYQGSSGSESYNPSASMPTYLGWFDRTGEKQSQLDYIDLTVRAATTDGYQRLPQTFNVEGYDAAVGEWVHIERFVDQTIDAGTVMRIEMSRGGIYSGFRIAVEDTRETNNLIQFLEMEFFATDVDNYFEQAGWDFVFDGELKRAADFVESLSERADAQTLTSADIESLLEVHLAEQRLADYAAADDLNYVFAPRVYDYATAGLTLVDAANLADHNAMIEGSFESNITLLQNASTALVNNEFPGSTPSEVLNLVKLMNYDPINGDYLLALDDFVALGVTGVTADNILQIGSRLAEAMDEYKDSISDIQSLVDIVVTESDFAAINSVEGMNAFTLSSSGINLATRYIWMFDDINNGQTRSYTSLDALSDGINVAYLASSTGTGGTGTTTYGNFNNATDGGYAEVYNGGTNGGSNLVYLTGNGSYNLVDLGAVYALDEIGLWARSDSAWGESTGLRGFFSKDSQSNSYSSLQNSGNVAEEYLGNELNFAPGANYSTKTGSTDAWGNFQPGSQGTTQRLTDGSLLVGEQSPEMVGVLNFDIPASMTVQVLVNNVYLGDATLSGRQWSFDFDGLHSFSATAATTLTLRAVDTEGNAYASTTNTVHYIDVGISANDGAPTLTDKTEIYDDGLFVEVNMTDYLSLGAVVTVFVDGVEVGQLSGGTTKSLSGWIDTPIAQGTHEVTARIDNTVSGETGTLSAVKSLQTQVSDASLFDILVDDNGGKVSASGTSDDEAPDLVIDIQDHAAGDNYFLYIDDELVDIVDPTAEQIAAQEMVLTDFDLSAYDKLKDGEVEVAVRVVHSDGSEVVSEDVTYLYQQ